LDLVKTGKLNVLENKQGRHAHGRSLHGADPALGCRVLISASDTDTDIRRAVVARAAALDGRTVPTTSELPGALETYVDKVAGHAYKVTDNEFAARHPAGFSQDAIFEVTLKAALGAGMSRLERGLALLKGGEECG
jgi:hypothetical protein